MAITRLERKGRKNKNVAKKRVNTIKRLSSKPVIKNIDVDAIKATFTSTTKSSKSKAKKSDKIDEPEVTPGAQDVVEEKVAATKAEEQAESAPENAESKKA